LFFKRALAIDEKSLGPDHPAIVTPLNNLAALYFAQSDWPRAAEYWRRSTSHIIRRAERGALVGEGLTGQRKNEAARLGWQFSVLVKTVHRLASKPRDEVSSLREMFLIAQWVQSWEAA
jgi:hypothetical protein